MESTVILGKHWLEASAAESWNRMVRDGMPNRVTSAGRTKAEQTALYAAWIASGKKNPPLVAKPGTSRHEKGNAIDVPEPTRKWMHSNGVQYGWVNPQWAKNPKTFEPWHFEYDSTKDTKIPVIEPEKKEDEMAFPYFVIDNIGGVYEVTEFAVNGIAPESKWASIQEATGAKLARISADDLRTLRESRVALIARMAKAFGDATPKCSGVVCDKECVLEIQVSQKK